MLPPMIPIPHRAFTPQAVRAVKDPTSDPAHEMTIARTAIQPIQLCNDQLGAVDRHCP
jgi:hypothetical protein